MTIAVQQHVRIGATETKRTDCGSYCAFLKFNSFIGNFQSVKFEHRVGLCEMHIGRDFSETDSQKTFDKTGNSGSSFQMAGPAFNRSNYQRVAFTLIAVDIVYCINLNSVSQTGSGSVTFKKINFMAFKTGFFEDFA